MTAIDTNVYIYILERHPQFYPLAAKALETAAMKNRSICVPTLVVTEILSGSDSEVAVLQFFANDSFKFFDLDLGVARLAGQLRFRHPSLGTADAIHLATARQAGAHRFITNDTRLIGIDAGLEIVPLSIFKGE